MPIYEYQCEGCKRTIEQLGKMSDPEILAFNGCVNAPCELKRMFSVCAFKMAQAEYEPPPHYNPMQAPTITRDWMEPDGTLRAMSQEEIARSSFIGHDA